MSQKFDPRAIDAVVERWLHIIGGTEPETCGVEETAAMAASGLIYSNGYRDDVEFDAGFNLGLKLATIACSKPLADIGEDVRLTFETTRDDLKSNLREKSRSAA